MSGLLCYDKRNVRVRVTKFRAGVVIAIIHNPIPRLLMLQHAK